MIQLADKLKKLRHKKGISQELLAKELEISRQAISKWESDTAQPDLDNLAKLCEIFNISADDLLEIHIEKQASVSDENGDCSKEVTASCSITGFSIIKAVSAKLGFSVTDPRNRMTIEKIVVYN